MSLITGNDDANNDDADTLFVVRDDVLNGICTYSNDSDNDKKNMTLTPTPRVNEPSGGSGICQEGVNPRGR